MAEEQRNMAVNVSFPGYDKMSAPVKSLVNFFIENSSIFFESNGSEAEYPDSFSCNISTDTSIITSQGDIRLCAKYEDLSDDRFKPYRILRASYASCTSSYDSSSSDNGIYNLTVKAVTPGTSGNGYSIRIIINSSAPYRELELRNGNDVIGRGTLTSNMLEKYSSEMYYFNVGYAISLSFYNGEALSDYVKLSGGGYCYFKRANGEGANSAYIEVGPTSGGTDEISYNEIDYDVSDWSSVLRCNTVLCEAKSNIKLYGFDGWDEYENQVWVDIIPQLSIPITIKPIIDDSYVNNDDSVVPQSLDSDSMTVINIANRDNRKYDTQLRTSTLTIGVVDYSGSAYITKAYNLHYKIGICPIDGKVETRDNIVEYLKRQAIYIVGEYSYFQFTLDGSMWQNSIYKCNKLRGSYNHKLDSEEWLPKSIIIPIEEYDYDGNHNIIAIMYARLCNDDGSYFTEELDLDDESHYYSMFIRSNESQGLTLNEYSDSLAYATDSMYIHFEDSNVKGFVRSNVGEVSVGPSPKSGDK